MKLAPELRADYLRLWSAMQVRPERKARVMLEARTLNASHDRYQKVASHFGMPWQVVAVIHSLESGGSFNRHFHNGDPLTKRTVQVPVGRPLAPPKDPKGYTWEESAIDALEHDGARRVVKWDVPNTLFFLEGFNGFGYWLYHPEEKSPYLWSFSTADTLPGKYRADGKFDAKAPSDQVGAALMLQVLGWIPAVAPKYTEVVEIVRKNVEEREIEEMGAFQRLVLGLLNRLLGELWISLWVFLAERLVEAETKWKSAPGSGQVKKDFVVSAVNDWLKPKVDRLPFFVRPFIWSGVKSLVEDIVTTVNGYLGEDWVSYLDDADDRVAYALEPLIRQDLNGDGIIGPPPPVVTTTTTTVKTTGGN